MNNNNRETIVFFGDSLTEWGDWDKLLPEYHIINLGVAGQTVAVMLHRTGDSMLVNAAKVFVLAGINDMGDGIEPAEIAQRHQQLTKAIGFTAQKAGIYVVSLLPADTNRWHNKNLSIEKIRATNLLLQKHCEQNNYTWINIHDAFAGEAGLLKTNLSTDGIHLSIEGYELYRNLIENYLRQ